jgi:hypothetical protein
MCYFDSKLQKLDAGMRIIPDSTNPILGPSHAAEETCLRRAFPYQSSNDSLGMLDGAMDTLTNVRKWSVEIMLGHILSLLNISIRFLQDFSC